MGDLHLDGVHGTYDHHGLRHAGAPAAPQPALLESHPWASRLWLLRNWDIRNPKPPWGWSSRAESRGRGACPGRRGRDRVHAGSLRGARWLPALLPLQLHPPALHGEGTPISMSRAWPPAQGRLTRSFRRAFLDAAGPRRAGGGRPAWSEVPAS
ncbi:PREDICTED: uncharacterized protein LOC108521857 [Rhinopithecus bieti]|uniref:uncharacterized protein LOC108521857 n=1 Tax=Rhinopithecus bieti TaxID=61621 RepID=UPI00083BBB7B|nr:PREDICTED: uncharacterized protein LOC108521857 [Rhinopithecus bieti]